MVRRFPFALLPLLLCPPVPAQLLVPGTVGDAAEEAVDGVADEDDEEVDPGSVVDGVVLPTAEQVAALPQEERVRMASAVKTILLRQTIRLLAEERRLSNGNLAESADLAHELGAPEPMERILRLLVAGGLDVWERRELGERLDSLYRIYGVDALEIRLFVETSGIPPELLHQLDGWLPMEPVFNLPPVTSATEEELKAQVQALDSVYAALAGQFATVQDAASADAAAEALLGQLPVLAGTAALRLSPPEVQGRLFAARKEVFISTHQAIQGLRESLEENDFYGSVRLRALDYLLH